MDRVELAGKHKPERLLLAQKWKKEEEGIKINLALLRLGAAVLFSCQTLSASVTNRDDEAFPGSNKDGGLPRQMNNKRL